jgi:phosphoribosyl-ATP pyrophosphohydrolase
MIVPSIDLQGGQAVQLIGGKKLAIEAGDPMPIAERFSRVGEIAVIDLDAAMGTGSNAHLVEALCQRFPCRVGGGIRDEATARRWLDAGARKIILGTAAKPELLSKLPKDRVQAALDAVDGEVVVEGWKTKTGARIEDKMAELLPYVGGFLITFVEREGRLGGTAIDRMAPLIAAAGKARITFAGGFTTGEDIAEADRLGGDAQVGMALYSGRLSLAEGFSAPLRTDRADGLLATVVVDANGQALGLCWSSQESLAAALDEGRGIYWSRSRNGLWRKGETSGAVQRLIRVDVDCDRDALRFVVEQSDPGFCHLDTWTCWGPAAGLSGLEQTLHARKKSAPEGSYSKRLFTDPTLLAAKLREEADELARAESTDEIAHEAADVIYFTMARMAAAGVSLEEVGRILDRRALKITRRPGDAKT